MSPFHFRFERLLKVKSLTEEQWKREFARARIALDEALERRDAGRRRLEHREAQLRAAREEGGLSLDRMLLLSEYVNRLRRELEELQRDVEAAEARAEEVRAELVEATKARKVLEALKERHRLAYMEEQNRIEQRELDEVARNIAIRPKERR